MSSNYCTYSYMYCCSLLLNQSHCLLMHSPRFLAARFIQRIKIYSAASVNCTTRCAFIQWTETGIMSCTSTHLFKSLSKGKCTNCGREDTVCVCVCMCVREREREGLKHLQYSARTRGSGCAKGVLGRGEYTFRDNRKNEEL